MSKKSKETYFTIILVIIVALLIFLLIKADIINLEFRKTDYILPVLIDFFKNLQF